MAALIFFTPLVSLADFTVSGKPIHPPSECKNKIKPERIIHLPLPKDRPISKNMRTDGKTVVLTMAKGDNALFSIDTDGSVLSIENNFKDEAFLEPCGRFIISPNHKDGMHYYRVSDVIAQQKFAKPVLVHPLNDFYQSASSKCENGTTEMTVVVQHMLQSAVITIDGNGKVTTKSVDFLCKNFYDEKTLKLFKVMVPDLDLFIRVKQAMFEESKNGLEPNGEIHYDLQWSKNPVNAKRFGVSPEGLESLVKSFKYLQGLDMLYAVAEPILAPSSGYFAGLTREVDSGPSLKLFKMEDGQCKKVADLDDFGGKPVFSYEHLSSGLPKFMAYDKYRNDKRAVIYFRDLKTQSSRQIQFSTELHGNITYPAFSRNGKLIVLNQRGDLMFFDPKKIMELNGCAEIGVTASFQTQEPNQSKIVR